MKKIVLSLIIALFSMMVQLKADQLMALDKNQATKAVEYLKNNKEVIEFCGCCTEDFKKFMTIYDVRVREEGQTYYVSIKWGRFFGMCGGLSNSYEDVDLAYIYTKIGDLWLCLGQVLKMPCDPCVEPFKFDEQRYNSNFNIANFNDNIQIEDLYPLLKKSFAVIICEDSYSVKESKDGSIYSITFYSNEINEMVLSSWSWSKDLNILDFDDIDEDGKPDITVTFHNEGGGCGGNVSQNERWIYLSSCSKIMQLD